MTCAQGTAADLRVVERGGIEGERVTDVIAQVTDGRSKLYLSPAEFDAASEKHLR
ncbi:MAG TPA: hypothetical protein VNP92_27770 [Actinophytocola sp.]|nr:hypothetical protein [Actinophytocola sp.]